MTGYTEHTMVQMYTFLFILRDNVIYLSVPSRITKYVSMAKYRGDQTFDGISHMAVISDSVTPTLASRNVPITCGKH